MLKHRIIPCVLLKDWQLVKSIEFKSFRTIGHPVSTARIYNARGVDELILLDIDASLNNEPINLELIEDISNELFVPLTIGGGIKNIEDIYNILDSGADKISINTKALESLDFITEASNVFGSQCIVCSIDVKKINNKYKVFHKKQGVLEIDPVELALKYQEYGAGEILLTSIDKEGKMEGFDIELLKYFSSQLKIPLIINGGMGKPQDAVTAINNGADAVAGAYIFHFSKYTPNDIKKECQANNIPVRINQ